MKKRFIRSLEHYLEYETYWEENPGIFCSLIIFIFIFYVDKCKEAKENGLAERKAIQKNMICEIEEVQSAESKVAKKVYELLLLTESKFKPKFRKGTKIFQQNQARVSIVEKSIIDLISKENVRKLEKEEPLVLIV